MKYLLIESGYRGETTATSTMIACENPDQEIRNDYLPNLYRLVVLEVNND